MTIILLFFFGFIFSFIGSITPSMLNMTAIKVSLDNGRKAANNYALGVSIIVFIQVVVAVILTKYILNNPTIIETLEKFGIVIFSFLSYYFYRESKKRKVNINTEKLKKENAFLTGVILSVLNMFAIPFYSGTVVTLDLFKLFNYDFIPVLFFTLGSVIGTFYILYLYGKFAKIIQQKTGKLTKDINLVLSILTGFVAIFTLLKFVF